MLHPDRLLQFEKQEGSGLFILPPVSQTNIFSTGWGKQAVRNMDINCGQREAQLINIILLALAGIHEHAQKKVFKFDVDIFSVWIFVLL